MDGFHESFEKQTKLKTKPHIRNTQRNYRIDYNKRGIWNKDILGGFFQKANKLGGGLRVFGTHECTFKSV